MARSTQGAVSPLVIGRRALGVLGIAVALGLVGVLTPVSAHDAGAQHDWNVHLLPLAKDDFFTKKQANARFLNTCEPGTTPFAATIDVGSLTDTPQDVNSLPESSAYNCTGLSFVASYSGDANYTLLITAPSDAFALEECAFVATALGDGMTAHVTSLSSTAGKAGDTVTLSVRTYQLADTAGTLSFTPQPPPSQEGVGELEIDSFCWG